MQEDVERQREEKAPEHQPAQQPEENSCYDPAKQALMDAYAALEAARARADAILLQADEEAEKRKEKLMGQFRLEMEKRGIAVLTSRYKIREQIEGLKRAKEELEQIRVCMEKASTRLPSESDDFYWNVEGNEKRMKKVRLLGAAIAMIAVLAAGCGGPSQEEYDQLSAEYESLSQLTEKLRADYDELTKQYDQLQAITSRSRQKKKRLSRNTSRTRNLYIPITNTFRDFRLSSRRMSFISSPRHMRRDYI